MRCCLKLVTHHVVVVTLPFDPILPFVLCSYIKLECTKTKKADIIFLVDSSKSITEDKFRSMKKFMAAVVNKTTVGKDLTRFGVILYSTQVMSVFALDKYSSKQDVLQAISALKSLNEDTYTGKALAYSVEFFNKEHGGRAASHVPQILMVITDGDATDHPDLEASSKALRDKDIAVLSIGVEGAKEDQLNIMTGGISSRVFYVESFDALETLYKNITDVFCNTTKPRKKFLLHKIENLTEYSCSKLASHWTVWAIYHTNPSTIFYNTVF